MQILCLGAGAIGGYFAGRLVEHGVADVTFLVRPGRKAQLEKDGLRIESSKGSFQVPTKAVLADDVRTHADYVLLTCKAYDLESAIETIRPAVGPKTTIVPMGMSRVELDATQSTLASLRSASISFGTASTPSPTMRPDARAAGSSSFTTRVTFASASNANAVNVSYDSSTP